jgi:predicted nucleic acid-binding Zn ribbon protein|tara:strand:+ start:1356 stop:2018 length:663 start_codon:yes stop_codon:yes gene_type:complete
MNCEFVGCETEVKNKGQRFCSKSCANLNRWGAKDKQGRVIIRQCSICGEKWEYRRSTRDKKDGRGHKVCSWKCRNIAIGNSRRGKPLTDAQKQKQSESMSGRTLTHEHRAKIGRGVAGSRNSKWIDGRSFEKEGAADYNFEFTSTLRTTVKRRDNHKCRKCNHDGSKFLLHVHHVDMNKENNLVENLVTVCGSCHSRIHCGTLENEFESAPDKVAGKETE